MPGSSRSIEVAPIAEEEDDDGIRITNIDDIPRYRIPKAGLFPGLAMPPARNQNLRENCQVDMEPPATTNSWAQRMRSPSLLPEKS